MKNLRWGRSGRMASLAGAAMGCQMLVSGAAWAGPAFPGLAELEQPDGSRFAARQRGDEWCNWTETADGYVIERDDDGSWRYRMPEALARVAERPLAQRAAPAGLVRHLHAACQQAPEQLVTASKAAGAGKFRVLFILASFTDRAGTYTESDFASFITSDIKGFYGTVSYGAATIKPASETYGTANNGVVGWLQMPYAHPNTGSNTGTANAQLAKDAIVAADPYVDFASYDSNGDGYVDARELAIVVIAAGYERSYSSQYTPNVWGHKWSVDSVGVPTVDGVKVGGYHSGGGGYVQFGEIHQSSSSNGHQATVGIMVHELGHLIFGLPDLYDTDGSSQGIGAWDVMSYGSWGRSTDATWAGETPVTPSAWTRYKLGWAQPSTGSGVATLTAVGAQGADATNTVWRASTKKNKEFFLIENRRPEGYDRGMETLIGSNFGGIAIWHVDQRETSNSDDEARLVDLEEADGSTDAFEASNLFYDGNSASSGTFNKGSTPSSRNNAGKKTSITINDFSTPAAEMTTSVTTDY